MNPVLGAIKLELEQLGMKTRNAVYNPTVFFVDALLGEIGIMLVIDYIKIREYRGNAFNGVDVDVELCNPDLIDVILECLGRIDGRQV